jgi:hypothetical protein
VKGRPATHHFIGHKFGQYAVNWQKLRWCVGLLIPGFVFGKKVRKFLQHFSEFTVRHHVECIAKCIIDQSCRSIKVTSRPEHGGCRLYDADTVTNDTSTGFVHWTFRAVEYDELDWGFYPTVQANSDFVIGKHDRQTGIELQRGQSNILRGSHSFRARCVKNACECLTFA